MNTNILLDIKNRKDFRKWLKKHSTSEVECYLVLKRGKPNNDDTFYYLDAVEEALCFGWIDSTLALIDGVRLQRFSPRRKDSNWTELNKERCRRLIKLGLMTKEGLKVLPDLNEEYKMTKEFKEMLIRNNIYDNFIKFPRLYQRIRSSNIKDLNTNNKALENLIKNTKENKMYGEWNDYGRLINY